MHVRIIYVSTVEIGVPSRKDAVGCPRSRRSLAARGASAIRIRARIHACHKYRKINAPLGAGFEFPTSTTIS